MRRTPEAEGEWADLYDQMADDDPGGLVGSITARAEAQTLRLSLVYALLDGANRVDVEHLTAAYAAWRYCRDSAGYVFGDSIGDEVADRLLAELRRASGGLTLTEQSAVFGRNVSAARLSCARQLLEDLRLAKTTTDDEATGGRPRTVTRACQTKETKRTNERGAR